MRVRVGDVRIHFEVIGKRLVPDGPALRERPTMLLAGKLDPSTPVAGHEEMGEAIRGSQLEVFAGAGHAPSR